MIREIPVKNKGKDALGRKEYIDSFIEIFEKGKTPLTISIQGEWGSGKTSFVKMLLNDLNEENFVIMYFDTWKYSQITLEKQISSEILTHFSNTIMGYQKITEYEQKRAMSIIRKTLKNVFHNDKEDDFAKEYEELKQIINKINIKKLFSTVGKDMINKNFGVDINSLLQVSAQQKDNELERYRDLLEKYIEK